MYGMVLKKFPNRFVLWLADGDHKKRRGIEFYFRYDGTVYWEDKSTGEVVRFYYGDTENLDLVTPFKENKKGKNMQPLAKKNSFGAFFQADIDSVGGW